MADLCVLRTVRRWVSAAFRRFLVLVSCSTPLIPHRGAWVGGIERLREMWGNTGLNTRYKTFVSTGVKFSSRLKANVNFPGKCLQA